MITWICFIDGMFMIVCYTQSLSATSPFAHFQVVYMNYCDSSMLEFHIQYKEQYMLLEMKPFPIYVLSFHHEGVVKMISASVTAPDVSCPCFNTECMHILYINSEKKSCKVAIQSPRLILNPSQSE